jgi:hypothetical protein
VVRERSAKPLCVSSILTRASNYALEILRSAQYFACGLPLRSRPQNGSSSILTRASNPLLPSNSGTALSRLGGNAGLNALVMSLGLA